MLRKLAHLVATFLAKYATEWSPDRAYIHGALQQARLDLTQGTREELCRLAVNMEHRNPIIQRLADIWECYTVGAGLQVMPASSSREWNERAKDWWNTWEQYPDIESRQPFSTLTSLKSRTWFVQGEVFTLFVTGEPRGKAPGYPRLQLIEGRRCMTPPDLRDQEGETVIDGCQIDGRGRTIGYYFFEEDSKGRKHFGPPVPAKSVLHLFEPSRAGQYRGVTLLHAALNELRDLDDLHHLEMLACKDAAEKSLVIENAAGEINPAVLLRRATSATNAAVPAGAVDNTEARAQFVQQALGGRTIALKTGEKFQQFMSTRPSVASREYWRYKTELACLATGIPYVMAFPESIQGTVLRGVLDMAATFFAQRFGVIREDTRAIYVRNILWAWSNRQLPADRPHDWDKVEIHAPRAPNVDVGYNMAASLSALKVGATDFGQIYGPQGLDWRKQLDALNEQLEYAGSIGLTDKLQKMNAAEKAAAPAEEEEEEETETEEAAA